MYDTGIKLMEISPFLMLTIHATRSNSEGQKGLVFEERRLYKNDGKYSLMPKLKRNNTP